MTEKYNNKITELSDLTEQMEKSVNDLELGVELAQLAADVLATDIAIFSLKQKIKDAGEHY